MPPNRERLKHLIAVMERVRDEGRPLDMSRYFKLPRNGEPFCKTAACVLGYSAMDPVFQAMGLSIQVMQWDPDHRRGAVFRGRLGDWHAPDTKWSTKIIEVMFGGNTGITAGAEFFGIPILDAERLFNPLRYRERPIASDDVIARIREILDRTPGGGHQC